MKAKLKKAENRGQADYGWLKARYSFSFANYYNPDNIHFGALRVLNDDIIEGGGGFGRHPHDNMEIVTIPLEGSLMHKDSMGHEEEIKFGDVQVMSAGTGIFHSEFNASKTDKTNILQLWIVPKNRQIKPVYDQKSFDLEMAKDQWQRLVSPVGNMGLTISQDAYISRILVDKNEHINYSMNDENNKLYLFQVKGNSEVNDITMQTRDGLELEDVATLTIKASKGSYLLAIEVPEMPQIMRSA